MNTEKKTYEVYTPLPNITPEQIEEARTFPISEVVASYGLLNGIKKTNKGYFIKNPFLSESEKTPSFLINTSTLEKHNIAKAYNASTGEKGYNPISFVMKYENLAFPKAVRKILNLPISNFEKIEINAHKTTTTTTTKESDWQPLTDKTSWKYKELKKYLEQERFINSEFAQLHGLEYLQNGKYFSFGTKTDEGTFERFNAIKDKKKRYRCAGAKSITTILAKTKTNDFTVFEAYIDFLSFLILHSKTECKTNVIILNGVNQTDSAIAKIKPFNPTKIYLALDRDEAGNNANKAIKNAFKCKFYELSNIYDGKDPKTKIRYKDANGLLQARKGKSLTKINQTK